MSRRLRQLRAQAHFATAGGGRRFRPLVLSEIQNAGDMDCADANFGAWPSGDPILAEASMWGRPRVYEIDAEAYEPGHGTDEDCIRRAEEDGAVFRQSGETKLWSVSNNNKLWDITDVATLAGAARLYGAVRKWENQKVRRRLKQQLQTRRLTLGRG